MPLTGEAKRAYQRKYMPKWEAAHRERRKGTRRLSPAREGRFVSFDGEGFNRPDGSHVYALLQDSAGGRIEDWDRGLSTERCFRFLLAAKKRYGGRFCGVSYGFDYDVNNFLRDVRDDKLTRLHDRGWVYSGRWRIEWRPRRWFLLSELDSDNRTIEGHSVQIFDTLGFYGKKFVDACEDWIEKDSPDLQLVREGKDRRPTFTPADAGYMRRYNEAELRLMVQLTSKLKGAFDTAGIELYKYYGAGAAATKFLQDIDFKRYINPEVRTEVRTAARHAYFGGRIEVPVYGSIPGPLHDYDINSAYPSAALDLPDITRGQWSQDRAFRPELPFSVYHVRWDIPLGRPFYPFPWRAPEGAIFFPPKGRAWVWGPELAAAHTAGGFSRWRVRVLEAWHFTPDEPAFHPLEKHLREKYVARKRFEAEGNPAATAIKLTLNAIYGKLAQSVSGIYEFGTQERKGRRPTFHQIEYAGFMASTCRARVYTAACQKPDAILAFATDGILSSEPLDLRISEEMGDWDHEVFEEATLVQSGVYRLRRTDGTWVTRGRGFAERSIPWDDVLAAWNRGAQTLEVVGKQQFIGLGAVLPGERWEMWRRFISIPKELQLTAIGKRWDVIPPSRWTTEANPATGPTQTEPTDPFLMGLARGVEDMESAPWKPKFEDPDVRTAEEGAESAEVWPLEGSKAGKS